MHERIVVGQLPQTTDYEALEFDAVNRVTAVVKGTRRSEFFYDGLGRRVRIVEREGATLVSDRRYIWDGGEIVEERDGANTNVVTKRYFGAGVQEVAANATTNLFYSRDHLGSVREVTDANGNLVARYDYDPWGRQTQTLGTYKADWGYAGYFVHRASQLNLTWYRAYDTDLGRWVSRDPIEEDGGLNLYGFTLNNPLNMVDADGDNPLALAASPLLVGGPPGWLAYGLIVGGTTLAIYMRDTKFTKGTGVRTFPPRPFLKHRRQTHNRFREHPLFPWLHRNQWKWPRKASKTKLMNILTKLSICIQKIRRNAAIT